MNEDPVENLEREIEARARCERHLQAIDEWAVKAKLRIQRQLDFHHTNALAWMAALKLQTGQSTFDVGTHSLKLEKARATQTRDDVKLLHILQDAIKDPMYWRVKRSPNWTEIMKIVQWRPEQGGKQLAVTADGEEIPEDVLVKSRPPVEYVLKVTSVERDAPAQVSVI